MSHLVRGYFVRYNRADQQFSLHPIDRETAYRMIPLEDGELLSRRTLQARAADFFRQQRKAREEWKSFEDVLPVLDEYEQRLHIEDYDEAARLLLLVDQDYLWEWGQLALLQSLHDRLRGHIRDGFINRQHVRRLGWLKWTMDTEGAAQMFQQVLSSAREAGDQQSEADALDDLAQIARKRGMMQAGVQYHQQALTLYRAIGDRRGQAEALGGVGAVLAFMDPDPAVAACTEAVAFHRAMGNTASLAYMLNTLGMAHKNLGEYEPARAFLTQSLDMCREHNLKVGEALALGGLAWIEQDFGHHAALAEHGSRMLEIGRETGDLFSLSNGLRFLGVARFASGENGQGEADLRQATELAIRDDRRMHVELTGVTLAQLLLFAGSVTEAAGVLYEIEPYAGFAPPFLLMLGVVQACMGNDTLASAALEQFSARITSFPGQGRLPLWVQYSRALARTMTGFLSGSDRAPGVLEFRAAMTRCSPAGLVHEYSALVDAVMRRPDGERLRPIREVLSGG